MLYLDLETFSQTDLIFHGLRRYAECPNTGLHCMAYAFDGEAVKLWWNDEPFPQSVTDYFNTGGPITAHNSQFEQHVFEWVAAPDYDFIPPAATQWRCSMAMALTNGYPGGLDNCARALGLKHQKNKEGTRLISEYCKPGFLTEWKPGDKELMGVYCVSDVEVMREMVKCFRELTDHEWAEFHLNARINDRGIPVDVELCTAALDYSWEIAEDANREIFELTGGAMTKSTQRKSRDAWLFPKLTPPQMKLLEVYKKGEKKISLDQDHRAYLLACEDLDHDARQLLEFINDAGSSALKKYATAVHQHVDGCVHNTFLWNGAARTGRYAGKAIQPHNFRRDSWKQDAAAELIDDIINGYEVDRPSDTMARLLRAMIKSDDGLYWVDWSAIEGRVAPWLANCPSGEEKLDIYRDGRDVYKVTAGIMFHFTEENVTDELRQSGKIAELSLQYGGSHNALIGMAKKYGVTFEENEARGIVSRWRHTNPWAEQVWADYDKAIIQAVRNPGTPVEVGRVTLQSDGVNFLWMALPSGRLLAYPKPKWEVYETPWGEERVGPTFQTHHAPPAGEPPLRNHLRGALLFQNSVQAVAADLLRVALVEADAEELTIIGHIHDEIIGTGPKDHGDVLNEIMLENPWWAEGLPLATGGVEHRTRWGK